MQQKPSVDRDATLVSVTVASKMIGFKPKMVRALIRDGLLAGQRIKRSYYTSRHAIRVFKHGLVTCAPFHVGALATQP